VANNLNRVSIAGVGYSEVGRDLPLPDDLLVLQAVSAALEDAGLSRSEVDGISTMGGNALSIGWTLGMMPLSYVYTSAGMLQPGASFAEPAINAISAVASGVCDTCIALRLVRQSGTRTSVGPGLAARSEQRTVTDELQFTAPFGAEAAARLGGLTMQAHMSRYGTTEQQFAINAVNKREWASLNEDAIFRDPLTVEDYLASRYIAKPVRIYDCDYPVDAASAVIFTTAERARDCRKKAVDVEAFALCAVHGPDYFLIEDHAARNGPAHCAERLWARTDLGPPDVDVAELYDGFSIITFQWLEALGFCGEGESGPFVEEGNTRMGGSLPLNTDGGACNVGRRHGSSYCIEATRQLRGECGARQVENAEVALWSNSFLSCVGAVLLTGATD
jgi:acetyl-CoA acetyltransferase